MEAVGLDIGNGYGYASFQMEEKKDPFPMIPAKYNLTMGMPTDVYITPPKGEPIVVFSKKTDAQRLIKKDAEHGIHAVKTYLEEEYIDIKGIPVSVDKAYAAIARDLMLLVNEQRRSQSKEPLYHLVFTFPVAFAEKVEILNRMQKAIEEEVLDGNSLKVVGRLPEPAAVAIDYLYYVQHIATGAARSTKKNLTVLVYDLGHGTFDAALVKVGEKVGNADAPYLVLDKDDLPDVGGRNFDKLLYKEICSVLKKNYNYEPQSPNEEEAVRKLAVEIKHGLSDNEIQDAQYMMPDSEYAEFDIAKERFEALAQPLLNKTLEIIANMMERAQANKHKIDAIVLSGGGARMPMVEQALKQLVDGQIPVYRYRPSEAVSFGAARYAKGIALEESTEYAYGIEVGGSLEGEIRVLIPAGSKLPAVSEPIKFRSGIDRFALKIYRSQNKREQRETLPKDEKNCKSVIFLPFDLPANVDFELTMTVEKDYNVSVNCKLPDGTIWKKGTADWLGERSKG